MFVLLQVDEKGMGEQHACVCVYCVDQRMLKWRATLGKSRSREERETDRERKERNKPVKEGMKKKKVLKAGDA